MGASLFSKLLRSFCALFRTLFFMFCRTKKKIDRNVTSLEDIQSSYYTAIEDARVAHFIEEDRDRLAAFPIGKEFADWVRKVDVFTLDEGAANFPQYEDIVTDFNGAYRSEIESKLGKSFSYFGVFLPGELQDIGSCWDGSKVGHVDEMDSLYVIKSDKVIVRQHDSEPGCYRIHLERDTAEFEVAPREFRDRFADLLCELISHEKLPSCLRHGGYKNSRRNERSSAGTCNVNNSSGEQSDRMERLCSSDIGYSGVRYNGPAATSQFIAHGHDGEFLLTWDVTPVFLFLETNGHIGNEVRKVLQVIIKKNPTKMFPYRGIHLVPDMTENLWRLSTAWIEADTLRNLQQDAALKKAFSLCKVLASLIKDWDETNSTDRLCYSNSPGVDTVMELDRYLEMVDGVEKTTAEERLNKLMRYAHMWIPSDKAYPCYNEAGKKNISINTAAIKHILIRIALETRYAGAFSAPQADAKAVRELVLTLVRAVFEKLGNPEVLQSVHCLLDGMQISHFSVCGSVAREKYSLVKTICQQCRIVVSEALTEVSKIQCIQ